MAVYPSFIYYNKSLFDEAGLAYPPHEVGEQYEGKDWTWATVRDLAMKLTVDTNGNDATSADFDPENVDVYGLDAQFTENDARAWSTIFGGSGSVLAADGTTAQWPDNWRTGLKFFYDGIWKDHFIPNQTAVQALAAGNTFQSGRIAMDVVHQWYTCCVYPAEGTPAVTDWDIAVLPVGPDGNITSKLHADTIGILDTTEYPDQAFEALTFLDPVAGAHPDVGRHAGHREPAGRVLQRPRRAVRAARDRLERLDAHARLPGLPQPRGVHAQLPGSGLGEQGPRLQAVDHAGPRRGC